MKRINKILCVVMVAVICLFCTACFSDVIVEIDTGEDQVSVHIEKTESTEQDTVETTSSEEASSSDVTETAEEVQYYFRNDKLLSDHYDKHGVEMGFDSKESYEAAASRVINNPAALYKTEGEDGDGVYYIEETNEFVILSTDGYIRTYFNPGAGKAYFDRQ